MLQFMVICGVAVSATIRHFFVFIRVEAVDFPSLIFRSIDS
jgi:hypothetical protein